MACQNDSQILFIEGNLHRVDWRDQLLDPVQPNPNLVCQRRHLREINRAPGKPRWESRESEISDLRDGLPLAQTRQATDGPVLEGLQSARTTDHGRDVLCRNGSLADRVLGRWGVEALSIW